jgi:nicotinamidase-related amidase
MRKVLIVVDMQKDFVTGPLGSKEARAIVPAVMAKVNSYSEKDVFFTRDTHYADYEQTLEGRMLPVPHCYKGSDGWEIIPELAKHSNVHNTIDKLTFGYANWDRFDKDTEFELCGVCTDICVVSNALAIRMFFPNSKITVDAKCCAGVTPEKHAAALEVMKSCQIEVIGE